MTFLQTFWAGLKVGARERKKVCHQRNSENRRECKPLSMLPFFSRQRHSFSFSNAQIYGNKMKIIFNLTAHIKVVIQCSAFILAHSGKKQPLFAPTTKDRLCTRASLFPVCVQIAACVFKEANTVLLRLNASTNLTIDSLKGKGKALVTVNLALSYFVTKAQWTFFQVFVSSQNIQSSTRRLKN